MITKRLFLFAAYSRDGTIDESLIHYVKSLSEFGDIVFVMDSDCTEIEQNKIKDFTIFASGTRHCEYDFGSYKRAFIWADKNLNLPDYDYLYLVNDSMYGPLFDLKPYFNKMENLQTDAFGIVKNPHSTSPHIQSWFIGMRKTVFLSDWFRDHLLSVQHHDSKGLITKLYEHGFTKKLIENNLSWDCLYSAYGRSIYNSPKRFFKQKMPFIKKLCFPRHYGALGGQLLYILNHTEPKLRDIILTCAQNTYGIEYIKKTLTRNPFKSLWRNIKYTIHKLRNEGI
jgi:lipopolysaccharide biosynthesis protein